ncbi:hypothetical protein BH23BAC1_BH23BAC1_21140 [soil metagenome]
MNLLIVTPEKDAYSTTFIKSHFNHLMGNKFHLHGIFFPTFLEEKLLSDNNPFKTLTNKVVGKILKKDWKYFMKEDFTTFLKKNKIDIVLAEFGPVGAEVTSVCKKMGVPLIVHFHGFDAYSHEILLEYKELYQDMFDYAKAIIVVSRHMENQLKSIGAPPDKLIYNCYGPADSFFEQVPNFEQLNFITVGRFVDKKAPYLTLSAFKVLLQRVPEAKLLMVGDGPLLFTCKNLVNSWGISKQVQFPGAISHEKIREFYDVAYCFLQHSITSDTGDSEGTPVGILEAQAAGLPVISTRHAGITDVIIENETGFLVDEGDINSMAYFMEKLALDKNLAIKLGMEGRKRIQESFTLSKHINLLNEQIENAFYEKAY